MKHFHRQFKLTPVPQYKKYSLAHLFCYVPIPFVKMSSIMSLFNILIIQMNAHTNDKSYSTAWINFFYMGPGLWKSHFSSFADSCLESIYEVKCLTERFFNWGSWCRQCLCSSRNQTDTCTHTTVSRPLYITHQLCVP